MSLGKGLVGSVVGAAIGAAVWIGVSAATGMHLGILAIVVAGVAGFGMAQGNGGRGGAPAGVLAAGAALLVILSAKFVITQMEARRVAAENAYTAENAVEVMASEIADEMYEAGELDGEEWGEDGEWPAIVQYKAQSRWNRMSEGEQQEYLAARNDELAAVASVAGVINFLFGTLWGMNLVVMVLATGTAYGIGSRDMVAEAEARGISVDSGPGLAGFEGAPSGPAAPAKGKARSAPAAAETGSGAEDGGFRLPMVKEEREDNLPSIEEIRRKHAAAQERADAAEGRSEAA